MGFDPRLRVGPHVFVDDLAHPELSSGDDHHLRRVLRLGPGTPITLCNGVGAWRRAELGEPLASLGPVVSTPEPASMVRVAVAPVKGERTEWAVAKLTEIGVDEIVIVHTERSVVRWQGSRLTRHLERFERVVREAAMQSRRTRLPSLEVVDGLATLAARGNWRGADPAADGPPSAGDGVVIGPEGGLTDEELSWLGAPVSLGPQVLRSETAALAAGVLLSALRAGLVDNT